MPPASDPSHEPAHGQAAEIGRVGLRKCVLEIERCSCGGQLKIIAAIVEPVVIVGILTHLSLVSRAPPRGPAQELRARARHGVRAVHWPRSTGDPCVSVRFEATFDKISKASLTHQKRRIHAL